MIKHLIRKWPKPNQYSPKVGMPEGLIAIEYAVYHHTYDAIVIGGGGAGLRAGVSLAEKGYHTACISKMFPTRSHTVAATSGINAALGNMGEDDWKYHYYDTVLASQGLGDLEAIEYMCKQAAKEVYELEHYGMPFSRTENGKILQAPIIGQTTHFGKYPAIRCAKAGEKTGHSILHTLTSRAMQVECRLLVDYYVLELIIIEGVCKGIVAFELREAAIHIIQAHSTVIATGGCGRIYSNTTQAHTCTGDGQALIAKAGFPNQDLEFVQFHPLGLHGSGCLLTDRILLEGGYLINDNGQRFMNKYSKDGEKSSRDIISRAIAQEIKEGRGSGKKKDHVWLDITHLKPWEINSRIPGFSETIRIFGGIDSFQKKIPVSPAAHYSMGGIPTDSKTRVIINSKGNTLPGLYAAGEVACISVHGANRLPANSLLDILVFGKAAANTISETIKPGQEHSVLPSYVGEELIDKIERIRIAKGKENVYQIKEKLQNIMQEYGGVIRNENSLQEGIKKIEELPEMLKDIRTINRGTWYNTEILDTLELENMIIIAKQTLAASKYRQESRGAHYREDHPDRNDEKWKRHTLSWLQSINGEVGLDSRPVKEINPNSSLSLEIKS